MASLPSKKILSLSVSLAALALTAPVSAQELALEEVVVTAQKRAQNLQDVPMAVDVASGEQIQKLNLFDFKDVARLAPGLQMTNNDGRQNVATLRGISFNPDTGAQAAVDVYINEVPVDAQAAFTALYDVSQIEVLRGPQGALRGRTAPAGAITLTTRRPSLYEYEGYAQGTWSNRHAFNLQGAVSVPLVEEKLAFRVAGLLDGNRLNQVRNVSNGERSRSRTQAGRLSIAWAPTEDVTVNFVEQYLKARNDQYGQVFGPGNTIPFVGFPGARLSGPAIDPNDYLAVVEGPQHFTNRQNMQFLNVDWDMGDHSLSFVGGHLHNVLKQTRDQDVGNAVPGYQPVQRVKAPYKVWNLESRLQSNHDGFWNYMFGLYFYRGFSPVPVSQKSDQFFSPLTTPFLPIDVDIYIPNLSKQYAAFTSQRFQITDKLRAELGLRYTIIKTYKQSFLTLNSAGNPAFGVPGFSSSTPTIAPGNTHSTERPLTGGASVTYEVTPDTNLYVSYGRSYRGSNAAVGQTAQLDQSLIVTKSETSNAVEVGIKSELFDRRIQFNADVFYQKFSGYLGRTDLVRFSSSRSGVPDGSSEFNFNGDAKVKGIEMQLNALILEGWTANASASYVDAKYSNALSPCNDFNGDGVPDAVGTPRVPVGQQVGYCTINSRLGEVPKFTLTLGSEYARPIGQVEGFVRGLATLRPGFHSERIDYDYKGQVDLNLFLGIRGKEGEWELLAFMKNALNQKRITNITAGTFQQVTVNAAAYDSLYRGINMTRPREIGITARYSF